MCGQLICAAAVLLAVDAGWQPLPDGGVEYLIQLEPHMVARLRAGEPVHSDIPPGVKDVRAYRITLGNDALPRQLPEPSAGQATRQSPPSAEAAEPTPRMVASGGSSDPFAPRFAPPLVRPGGAGEELPRWGATSEEHAALPKNQAALPPQASPREFLPPRFGPIEEPIAAQPPPPEAVRGSTPRTIQPDPTSQPLEAEVASYVIDAAGQSVPREQAAQSPPTAPESAKPWLPLILTLLGLFASLGANLFLAWSTWDARRRYRALAQGA